MKTANIYLFIAALCIPLLPLKAQRGVNNIKVESTEVTRENGIATLNMLLNLDAIDLKSQEMLYLFPVLVSPDSINEYSFNPVVVTGAKRGKALERMIKYDNFTFEKTPQIIIPYKKRNDQLYPLKLTVNYQDWLQNASLVFYEDVTGCNCRNEYSNRYTVLSPILPYLIIKCHICSQLTTEYVVRNTMRILTLKLLNMIFCLTLRTMLKYWKR
ncbi:MAG: DUF3868 domain-containing protein [Bacteroides sp.]|nr:DUF3868 domain-containing protein [Bacteroides sp.]